MSRLLSAALLAGCGGGGGDTVSPPPPPAVSSVAVTPGAASILVGETASLSAIARDNTGATLSGKTFTWTSAAEAVATVSTGGVVTGVGSGTTQIRATTGGVTGTATVTVSAPVPPPAAVAAVTVTPNAPTVMVGSTTQLAAVARDNAGNALSGRLITWSSSNEAIATVSIDGLATGIAAGTAQLRATSEGVTGSATVTVTPVPVASVTVSPGAATLVPTQTATITATARDAQGNALTGRSFTWATSNATVATVSNGLVTAVTAGSATVTATSEGKSAQATISVVNGTIVGPAGGNVVGDGGNVTIAFPAGALSSGTGITVQPLVSPPAHPRLVPGTAFEFGPSGTTFAAPVSVTIRFTIPNLGAAIPVNLRLHRFANGTWTQLPGGSVNLGNLTVSGQTTTFSTYGLIEVVPPVLNFTTVSAGEYHSCGVADGGQGYCWGGNDGRLGNGTTTGIPIPSAVSGNLTFSTISAGGAHSCGLTTAGHAWCWGLGTDGQLGQGAYASSLVPVAVAGGHTFQSIDAGAMHTCGVTNQGVAVCWGEGIEGRLGDGVNLVQNHRSNVPVAVVGAQLYLSISAGDHHTCALTVISTIWCWGVRTAGQLGDGSFGSAQNFYASTPVQVTSFNTWSRVATGAFHTCAINTQGEAWCWGDNNNGKLGNGDGSFIDTAVPVKAGTGPYVSIAAGNGHSCAVTATNVVQCWGRGSNGQLGVGATPASQSAPAGITSGQAFAQVSAGGGHTCARTTAGPSWCWGEGFFGALGDGGSTDKPLPTAVVGPALTAVRRE